MTEPLWHYPDDVCLDVKGMTLKEALETDERWLLCCAMHDRDGDVRLAAKDLDVPLSTMYCKLAKYEIALKCDDS